MKLQLYYSESLWNKLSWFKKYGYPLTLYKKQNYIYLNTESTVVLHKVKKTDVIPNEYNINSLLENNMSMTGKYLVSNYILKTLSEY
jgi:hypothetical protein